MRFVDLPVAEAIAKPVGIFDALYAALLIAGEVALDAANPAPRTIGEQL